MDHTVPMKDPEGVHSGLLRFAYQGSREEVVATEPIAAATKDTPRNTTRATTSCSRNHGEGMLPNPPGEKKGFCPKKASIRLQYADSQSRIQREDIVRHCAAIDSGGGENSTVGRML